jgi:hypothetical protein
VARARLPAGFLPASLPTVFIKLMGLGRLLGGCGGDGAAGQAAPG